MPESTEETFKRVQKQKVVAIVGPTASGKTALSISLAGRLNAEIVACDSRTIYRGMDIGTAKPSAEEQARTRHHMLDLIDPNQGYSVALYAENASAAIDDIASRGKLPIIVGGTGFYASALLEDLNIPAVPPQPELRASLREIAEREGNAALHQRLADVDPVSAERINPNDIFRVVRALEVSAISGKPFSQAATKGEPRHDVLWLGLTATDREFLRNRIRARLDQQATDGILEEAQGLYEKYGPADALVNTVNYAEMLRCLQGEIDKKAALELCYRSNSQLARRQLIWFRRNENIHWMAIDEKSLSNIAKDATDLIHIFIGN